jgi:hypothetical protein
MALRFFLMLNACYAPVKPEARARNPIGPSPLSPRILSGPEMLCDRRQSQVISGQPDQVSPYRCVSTASVVIQLHGPYFWSNGKMPQSGVLIPVMRLPDGLNQSQLEAVKQLKLFRGSAEQHQLTGATEQKAGPLSAPSRG